MEDSLKPSVCASLDLFRPSPHPEHQQPRPGRVLCGLGCPQPPRLRECSGAPPLCSTCGWGCGAREWGSAEWALVLDLPGVVLFVSVKLKSSYSQGGGLEKQWECLKKHGGDFRLNLAVKNELEQDEDGAKKGLAACQRLWLQFLLPHSRGHFTRMDFLPKMTSLITDLSQGRFNILHLNFTLEECESYSDFWK